MDFREKTLLIDRTLDALEEGRALFVLGSALHLPQTKGGPGVPSAWAMVDLVRTAFKRRRGLEALEAALEGSENAYQTAFRTLIDRQGLDAANAVIRQAVQRARTPGASTGDPLVLEGDLAGWSLSPGAAALGKVLAKHPKVPVITTNFDPLVEVAVRRANGSSVTASLTVDGSPSHMVAPNTTQVVHIHGFWRGDTLHTRLQLTEERPRLHQSLLSLFRERVVIVLGYGGWDDAIVRALHAVAYDAHAKTDVLWAFYEDDTGKIEAEYAHVFKTLAPAPMERVVAYAGVDVQAFLPELLLELGGEVLSVQPVAAPIPALKLLTDDEVQQVLDAALKSRLFKKRETLLTALPEEVDGLLSGTGSPIEQISNDVRELNRIDGRVLAKWLDTAAFLTPHPGPRALFKRLAERLRS